MSSIDDAVAATVKRAVLSAVAPLVAELTALRSEVAELRAQQVTEPSERPEVLYESPVDFAKRLGVSERSIRARLQEGLPHTRVGRRVRIPIRVALQFLDQRAIERAGGDD